MSKVVRPAKAWFRTALDYNSYYMGQKAFFSDDEVGKSGAKVGLRLEAGSHEIVITCSYGSQLDNRTLTLVKGGVWEYKYSWGSLFVGNIKLGDPVWICTASALTACVLLKAKSSLYSIKEGYFQCIVKWGIIPMTRIPRMKSLQKQTAKLLSMCNHQTFSHQNFVHDI